MALVVKKIGNYNYLYEQHSKRVDGKVVTNDSKYLGKYDGSMSKEAVKAAYKKDVKGMDNLGLTGWQLEALKGLTIETKEKFSNAKDTGDYLLIEGDGGEYMVFESYEDAERYAQDRVKDDLDNEPELFSRDWLENHIYISDTDRRIMADEEADNYVGDIDDERAVEEAKMQTEYDDTDDDAKKEKIVKEAREKLQQQIYDEWYEGLKDPIGFLCDEQGIYSKEDLLKQSFIQIDTDDAARDAVLTDGVAHFLATYDGEELELPGGAYAYRTN